MGTNKTFIDWARKSVNGIHQIDPKTGKTVGWYCEQYDEGCTHCYAKSLQERYYQASPTFGEKVGGEVPPVAFNPSPYQAIARQQEACSYFFNSMTDWCEPSFVQREWAFVQLDAAASAPRHLVYLLTKRHDVLVRWAGEWLEERGLKKPPENIYLGMSLALQKHFTKRSGYMLALQEQGWNTWWSCEPLLGQVDLHLDEVPVKWIVFGGESDQAFRNKATGKMETRKARPCDWRWLAHGAQQCEDWEVACFIKQVGSTSVGWTEAGLAKPDFSKKGGGPANVAKFPEQIRVRQMPPGWAHLAKFEDAA